MTVRGDSFDTTKTSIYQLGDYREYEYDDFNRLVKVTKLNEDETALEITAEYVYNADGYRIMKTDGEGNTTTYTFDLDGKVLEEVTADEIIDYAYLGRKHLARMTDTETLYYGTDHLGSTILMTDETGEEVWTGAVTPFADEESTEGLEERVKYTGKDLDEDTGLYYFNARWYDPLNGRFITEDPVRDGLNWYIYVSNNPLKFVDPTGFITLSVFNYDATTDDTIIDLDTFNPGHTWMQIDMDDDGIYEKYYGWGHPRGYASDLVKGKSVPGVLLDSEYENNPGYSSVSIWSKSINLTEEQTVASFWRSLVNNLTKYNYGGSQVDEDATMCSESVVNCLKNSGILSSDELDILSSWDKWSYHFPDSSSPRYPDDLANETKDNDNANPNEMNNKIESLNLLKLDGAGKVRGL